MRNLTYEKTKTIKSFSFVPSSGYFDLTRLTRGLPYFENIVVKLSYGRKKIVFPTYGWSNAPKELRIAIAFKIAKLKAGGHEIYYQDGDRLTHDAHGFYEDVDASRIKALDSAECAALLDTPSEELCVFTIQEWAEFLEGQNESKLLAPKDKETKLKEIKLNQSGLNAQSLAELLNAYSEDLETLELNQFLFQDELKELDVPILPNLKRLRVCNSSIPLEQFIVTPATHTDLIESFIDDAEKLESLELIDAPIPYNGLKKIDLSELKELVILNQEVKGENPSNELLEYIFKNAPKLEKVNVTCAAEDEYDIDFSLLNVSLLKHFSLNNSNIKSQSLNKLLQTATQLEHLSLTQCTHLHEADLKGIELRQLKSLDLRETKLSSASIAALLAHTERLENLDLGGERLNHVSMLFSNNVDLTHLKQLGLVNQKINSNELEQLLQQAELIEVLNLDNTRHTGTTLNREKISLSRLKKLNLNGSDINPELLQKMLHNAYKLEELNFQAASISLKGFTQPLPLSQLKKLDLAGSSMDAMTLKCLVQNADHLEELNLKNALITGSVMALINLPQLRTLNLNGATLDANTLHYLTQKAPHLTEINLNGAKISGSITSPLGLPNLHRISLTGCSMKAITLQHLLQNTSSIEELDLSLSTNMNDSMTEALFMPRLKKLDATGGSINATTLCCLLQNAPEMTEINVSKCKNLKESITIPLNLPHLKKLDVHNSPINTDTLVHMLQSSIEIEEIDLSKCDNLTEATLLALELPHLKKLDLSKSSIHADTLKQLLHQASLIEAFSMPDKIHGLPPLQYRTFFSEFKFTPQVAEQINEKITAIEKKAREKEERKQRERDEALRRAMGSRSSSSSSYSSQAGTSSDTSRATGSQQAGTSSDTSRATGSQQAGASSDTSRATGSQQAGASSDTSRATGSQQTGASTDTSRATGSQQAGASTDTSRATGSQQAGASTDTSRASGSQQARASTDTSRATGSQQAGTSSDTSKASSSQQAGASSSRSASSTTSTGSRPKQNISRPIATVDANTKRDTNTNYNIERLFIGKPYSPHYSQYRLHSYNKFTLNTGPDSDKAPFLLFNDDTDLTYLNDLPRMGAASKEPLYKKFERLQGAHIFGRYELDLSLDWQPMPSARSTEILRSFYLSEGLDVEIVKSPKDHFHYIRLKPGSEKKQAHVTMEVLMENPKPAYQVSQLPAELRELINDCSNYRDEDLDLSKYEKNPQIYLNEIKKERAGACRHRSVAFKDLMRERFPDVPVQIIDNDCHMYAEVYYQGTWVSCDLGGYPAHVKVNENHLSEAQAHEEKYPFDPFTQPAEMSRANFSNRGRRVSEDFWKKATNLSNLRFNQSNLFIDTATPDANPFSNYQLEHLDTLELSDCIVSANRLNQLFALTPHLKTLKLINCQMSPESFAALNLGGLKKLEHVTFTGHFVPDNKALEQLISKTDHGIKWVIDSPNIIAETLKKPLHHKVTIQPSQRTIPRQRYLTTEIKKDTVDAITSPVPSILLKTNDSNALSYELQTRCRDTGQAFFYIDTPEELQCGRPYVKRDGDMGTIQKGPGGPLYDFIKKNPKGTLIINYDNFKAADMARLNSVLDKSPHIDNVALPKEFKVIGVLNVTRPQTYQGADFYSRFAKQQKLRAPVAKQREIDKNKKADPESHVIELAGGADWQARLFGHWILKGEQFIYKEGKLIEALREGKTKITFNNPPMNDPEFERFLKESELHHGIYHQGVMLHSYTDKVDFDFTYALSFPDKDKYLSFNQASKLSSDIPPLNSALMSQFIGKYEMAKAGPGLQLKPGLIEEYKNKTLPIYLTGTLSEHEWLNLFELAKQHNTKLDVIVAPNVRLPDGLKPRQPLAPVSLVKQASTNWISSPLSELESYPKDAIVIDISELSTADLLPSIHNKFDEETLKFSFSERLGFLEPALAEGKTIVLKGQWSAELAQALHPLLLKRLQETKPSGHLTLVSKPGQFFPFMAAAKADTQPKPAKITRITVDFDDRLKAVEQVLTHDPFVFLIGGTGVGKTHFIKHIWKAKHGCHFGEKQIEAWINDPSPGLKTLFLDEANITEKQWSEFQGLFLDPPSIFYKGQYIKLSKEHKIIFAGNPLSFGGERQMPGLFLKSHQQIEFKAIPNSMILKQLQLDNAVALPIQKVIDYFDRLNSEENLLTPREINMMAALSQAAMNKYPDADPRVVATHFAYSIAKMHAPKLKKNEFDAAFKPTKEFTIPELSFNKFLLNQANRPAYEALVHQLNLRALRMQSKDPSLVKGGLGGLILEGESGIGKSVLSVKTLVAYGLKENVDFYHIPVSLSYEQKEARLLEAFHAGKIVIIDEINSSPMLEHLLNALLEGIDLKGDTAKNPGFMLLGTQNPVTYSGRQATTAPLKHRWETVVIPEYTTQQVIEIMLVQGIPPRIAKDMAAEYEQQKKLNPQLGCRTLLNTAKKWAKSHQYEIAIDLNLKPVPQTGSICKVVSIANIESYYANQLGYEAIPLRKDKKHPLSLRQLSKAKGSVQGEILEFSQWKDNLSTIGYETETVEYKDDINTFLNTIVTNLKAGNLPMIAFSVLEEYGHPNPSPKEPQEREHAAVITGYNHKTDEVTLSHWGANYTVDLVTLFNSNKALAPTRSQEHYKRNALFKQENKKDTAKYLPVKTASDKNSIIPGENTGFNGKLLVVKKPELQALMQKRKQLHESSLTKVSLFPKRRSEDPQTTDILQDTGTLGESPSKK